MRKAFFLDRDGIINKVIIRDGKQTSPRSFEEFELTPGIKEVLKELKSSGFLNIVITSQPEVERGLVQREAVDRMHDFIKTNLPVDDLFVCFHDDHHNCECRKPKPGLILEAVKKWDIDAGQSFILGDTHKDVGAGKAAGVKTIILDAFYNQGASADFRIKKIEDSLEIIKHSF